MRRLVLSLAALVGMPALADDTLRIPRATHAPTVDEYVGGAPPKDAGVEISDFRQNKPGDGEPASLETRAYLSYDDDHLYVVFVCKDDPALVRARIARREDIIGDEGVQILLDTFHDKQRAFVFSANPYGVQLDSKLTEGLGYDFNFDTQWTSDGRVTSDGYVVTMAIPFKSLRFTRGDQQRWGITVGRIIPRSNEFSYWPYITQRKEGFVPQFATAEIDAAISPGRNIQFIPYAAFGRTRALDLRDPANPQFTTKNDTRTGLDTKFVIKDALAVDLTVNPDFSEVESDEPQVIVNQRFEVQFPEKRPFFLENAGFFGTPYTLFFSRRIADPQYGARMTGRVDRWALGGLLIDDREAGKLLPPDDPDAGKRASIGVARVQRDFATQSNVGVLLTDRKLGEHDNRVLGLDTRMKLNDNWTFSGQAVQSRTQDRAVDDADGHLLFAEFTRGGRNFNYDLQYADISRDFSTDLGFVPRVDIKQLYNVATYLWQFPEAPWLVDAGPSVTAYRTLDSNNDLQDWKVDSSFVVDGLGATHFEGHWIDSYELFGGKRFRENGWQAVARTEWLKWLAAGVTLSSGDAVNYYPAPGVQPFLGDARQAKIELTVKPFPQLRIDETWIWNDLRTQGRVEGHAGGSRVFSNTIWRTKVNYQFNRFLAARVVFDYNGLTPDTDLVAAPRTKRLTGDVLLSYVLNPGTSLYVGYTDRQENLRLFTNPNRIEPTDGLDLHTGKQVFVKLSYLFGL